MSAKPGKGVYDHENFSKNVIPKGFSREDVALVDFAVLLGWELNIKDGNTMSLMSKEMFPPSRISMNNRSQSRNYAGLMRQVVEGANKERLALVSERMEGKIDPDLYFRILARAEEDKPSLHVQDKDCPLHKKRVPHPGHKWYEDADKETKLYPYRCNGVPQPAQPSTPPSTSGRALEKHEAKVRPAQVTVPEPTEAEVAEKVQSERYIVTSQPYLFKRRPGHREGEPGERYASETTMERHWSDGTVDYVCTKCDYTHPTEPRSVARHHGRSHPRVAPQVGVPTVRDPSYVSDKPYTPREDRVLALAGVLAGLGTLTPEKAAEAALAWVHEQSNQGSSLAGEAEELSDSEMLVRIKRLLDRGEYAAQRARVDDLTQRVIAAEAAQAEAEAKAAKATDALSALGQLAAEYTQQEAT